MSVIDDSKDAIDILAEGSISDQLNDAPADEPKIEEPKIDEKEAAREARFEKLEKQLLESQQEAQFMRGYLQRQQNESQQRQEPPEDKDEPLDYDALAKDMETRGAKALHEFVANEVAKGVKTALKESGKLVDGRLGAERAQSQRANLFKSEYEDILAEFPDFINDEEFKAAADKEASKTLAKRLGRPWQSIEDNRYYQPGDLFSAVKAAAYDRMKAGKIAQPTQTNGSSLREISRRVPATDNLGNGNNGHRNAAPKAIDDLGMSDKEKTAAKNVFNKLKELNPGMTETNFVKYYQEGEAARDQ